MIKYDYYVGIDTGVNTGIALWSRKDKEIQYSETTMIHRAMELITNWAITHKMNLLVRVEDARLRKMFGNSGREKLQGAGSIKRDAKVWEQFLTDNKIPFELVAPKNNKTKLPAHAFKLLTKQSNTGDQHLRDAVMLVYGF